MPQTTVDPSSTTLPGDDDTDSPAGDETRTVWLIVLALVLVALVLAFLTYRYWQRTRPARPQPFDQDRADDRRRRRASTGRLTSVAEGLDVDAMIERFRERAKAVRSRNLPPVAGPERTKFIQQAQTDFQDFAIIADAEATLDDGILTLRIDLRPKE